MLEAGPWTGTPRDLWKALEGYRQEPWPANPVALSLWLRHHAHRHGLGVTLGHNGEHRFVRLARVSNGLVPNPVSAHSAAFRKIAQQPRTGEVEHNGTESQPVTGVPGHTGTPPDFWSFTSWPELEAALPRILEALGPRGPFTLAFKQMRPYGPGTTSTGNEARYLPALVRDWAARHPDALEIRLWPRYVDIVREWPLDGATPLVPDTTGG
ncbi:hypothetical protein DNA98_15120 [Meiothermus sp. Pnk-1]|nr:hypothetical protein DNA98_15120 [Meiothermus sp. Pnk-1]